GDLDVVVERSRRDSDPPELALALRRLDRVHRVDDEIEQRLVHRRQIARHERQVRIEVDRELGDMFPLVPRDDHRALDRCVQVTLLQPDSAGMGEIAHRGHDGADLPEARRGLLQRARDFLSNEGDVRPLEELPAALALLALLARDPLVVVEHGLEIAPYGREKTDVVADVLRRRIDLVRDAGRELADRLELLCDPELRFDVLALGNLAAQRLVDARELLCALAHAILEHVVVALHHVQITPHANHHRGAEREQQHADDEQEAPIKAGLGHRHGEPLSEPSALFVQHDRKLVEDLRRERRSETVRVIDQRLGVLDERVPFLELGKRNAGRRGALERRDEALRALRVAPPDEVEHGSLDVEQDAIRLAHAYLGTLPQLGDELARDRARVPKDRLIRLERLDRFELALDQRQYRLAALGKDARELLAGRAHLRLQASEQIEIDLELEQRHEQGAVHPHVHRLDAVELLLRELERALPGAVRHDEQKHHQEEHADRDRERSLDGAHSLRRGRHSSASSTSPVNASRNATSLRISSSRTGRPSCTSTIIRTASSSVSPLPS